MHGGMLDKLKLYFTKSKANLSAKWMYDNK